MRCFLLILTCSIIALIAYALPFLPSGENKGKDFNIVLITIDALRADHLSCYGYERNTSPHIDKIVSNAIVFKNAIAPSSYTVPSMASLFTSLYPTNHGVLYGKLSEFYPEVFKQFEKKVNVVIPDELVTLAEVLKSNGYTTFGVSANLLLDDKTGFANGFDHFKHENYLFAPAVNKLVLSMEDEIKTSDKFFLWIHYMAPHFPYHPREPWIENYATQELTQKLKLTEIPYDSFSKQVSRFQNDRQALSNLIALYDSEINYVDFYIGELIKKLDLEKDSLIIITADHGEEFVEHGYLTHGNNLYNETIRVPLIAKLPGGTGKIVNKCVNLIDIMPSILDLLNIEFPEQMLGKSFFYEEGLIPWLKGIVWANETSNYTFSEISKENVLKTVTTGEWKYIHDYRNNKELLYNITADPLELNNLIDTQEGKAIQLKGKLLHWASNLKTYTSRQHPVKLTPEEEEKLKSIGYMQ